MEKQMARELTLTHLSLRIVLAAKNNNVGVIESEIQSQREELHGVALKKGKKTSSFLKLFLRQSLLCTVSQ